MRKSVRWEDENTYTVVLKHEPTTGSSSILLLNGRSLASCHNRFGTARPCPIDSTRQDEENVLVLDRNRRIDAAGGGLAASYSILAGSYPTRYRNPYHRRSSYYHKAYCNWMGSIRDIPLTALQLASHCVHCFDVNGDILDDEFPHSLFLSHQWLFDSGHLASLFINIFQESQDESLRRRVCFCVIYWITHFPMHFDGQAQLCSSVIRLRTIAEDIDEEIREQLDVSKLPSYAWLREKSVRHAATRQVSLSFEQWSPEDISSSLSHIDYRVLSRISLAELKTYVKEGGLSGTPVLERSITVFNNLSNWVMCMVLSKATPKERAGIITKFINVGKHLHRLCNFNTMMAVIGGITHSNISRLAKTNALLDADIKKELSQLSSLLSIQSNFAEYRKALSATSHRFRIPIVGVHLKDLIAFNCSNGSFEKTKTITRRKLTRLAALLSNFLVFNHKPHNFPDVNLDLINTLKVSLDIRYNEDDIYELSLRREPRTFMAFEPSHTPVVFAEWASGISAMPDPTTVNKHVSAMVDAVFKHYDHDRDGYISQAEFRQISGNFPFIDPFGTIDLDRDGQISKEELKAYFVKANKDSVDFRKGFKHNFHETTFLTPTTCSHCGKLLWGLIRQGWKCKDCGLAVHSNCKANAVAECRRRTSGGGLVDWLSSPRDANGARSKLFLSYTSKRNARLRTVSTVSTSPSPEPMGQSGECSTSAGGLSERSDKLQLPLPQVRSLRPQSETTAFYKSREFSPDEENDHGLASLACEEVFEDEASSNNHLDSTS